ncbi:MAG: ATP-dependent metallopeptidase FtsH/Yme1/Tma family protein, partial [Bacteroidetes bacterium]|nr:ATP-dependent metallopeptidase FtsH/Yme1/Tma family protein [Bacteroidota bacterium]
MAEKPNRKNLIPKPPQKNNYQAYIIVALLILIFGVLWLSKSSSTVPINYLQFEKLLTEGKVKEVALIKGQDLVEITLTPEAVNNSGSEQRVDDRNILNPSQGQGPHYRMKITSEEVFDKEFRELMGRLPQENQI